MDPDQPIPAPLELIRKTESGCRRRLAAARAASEDALLQARREAKAEIAAAAEAGRREGMARREQILESASQDVDAIRVAARRIAEAARNAEPQRIDRAAQKVLDGVLMGAAEKADDDNANASCGDRRS